MNQSIKIEESINQSLSTIIDSFIHPLYDNTRKSQIYVVEYLVYINIVKLASFLG